MEGVLQPKDHWSEAELLEKSSGGLALTGIFVSKDMNDMLRMRHRLLKVPEKCCLLRPSMVPREQTESFMSHTHAANSKQCMEHLGFSICSQLEAGFWGFKLDVKGEYSTSISSSASTSTESTYDSLCKMVIIPMASVELNPKDLTLSDTAVSSLKDVETNLLYHDSEGVKDASCQLFLEHYGSHVNSSNIHFGGIYLTQAESAQFKQKEKALSQDVMRTLINADLHTDILGTVEASVSNSASCFKSSFNLSCSKTLLDKINVSITKIGGPVEASSLAAWKAGLQVQGTTWCVIDRGPVHSLVPVWNIIVQRHRGDFQNYQLLSEALQRCWERRTGLKDEGADTAEVMKVYTSVEDLVQEVDKWNAASESDFVTNCTRNISQCARIKSSLRRHLTIDTDTLWYCEFICKSIIQIFISKVLQCVAENSIVGEEKAYLKVRLSDLLQPQGMIRSLDFPNISSILQQLTDIPNDKEELTFSSFKEANEHIKKLERKLQGLDVGNEFQRKVCNEMGKALFKLQLFYERSGDQYTALLLTALLHPVSYQPSGILNQSLTDNDCKYLISQLDKVETYRTEMKTMKRTQCQAFLLYKALSARVTESQCTDPTTVLQTLCAKMDQDISPQVREAVMTPSGTFISNMELLKETLQRLSEDKESQKEPSEHSEPLVTSIQRVCRENTINKHSDSPSDCTPRSNISQHNSAPQIVNDLGLQDYYPHKLSLNYMREICWDKLEDNKPTRLEDIPWRFLQRILSANSIARNLEWPLAQQSEDETETDEDFSGFLEVKDTQISGINPLDIIAAIFLCADYFLQQELMLKMSLCQFALPLLQPDGDNYTTHKERDSTDGPGATFLLWAMRSIVKTWCPASLTSSSSFVQETIVTAVMATVSFIRLGRCSISKSKILNLTLSQTQLQQNFFLHSEMECGNVPRGISDGLAEICWYLPSGNRNLDIFPEAAAFINLRGDAEAHQRNARFLAKVSAALFIFIDVIGEKEREFLTSLAQSPTKFFLITNSSSSQQKITLEQLRKLFKDLKIKPRQCIGRTNKNDSELVENLRSKIKQILPTRERDENFQNLEQMADIARESGIEVDANHPKIQRGKQLASDILRRLDPRDITGYKVRVLPFHGKPWQDWSEAEKEKSRMKRRGNKTTEEYKYELDQKKNRIREAQLQQSLSEELQQFITGLTTTCGIERAFFLQWLKLDLDSKSRKIMSQLCSHYKKLCEDSKQKTSELKDLDQKMSDSSLGLEHFMRELGQVYEVSVTPGNIRSAKRKVDPNLLRKLPDVAAELLLDGFPLELIDGDVSNIPVQWVTAVLNEVAKKVGTASRVFVLTVIGVQSTGKSTLLNTMFGLQFAVSSGRCTRGAFMQFIKVTGSLATELGCDFILVIDTEGLKAPELATHTDSYEHDNELATFLIGLSNLTLVNIGMENPSEMKDILQIAVHSLIRMRQTGKKAICQFVHQNVGDVCAHDQNLRSRQKLLEQLDQMTEAAAKLEKLDRITFCDVMDYDPDKSNWYIPGLWHGTPPMAAVNTGYSEHVFELKKCLIQCLLKCSQSQRALTMPDFIKWMSGVWEQVKNENFIFSFQNSVVAEAYNQLSMRYKDWEWDLRKFAHSWTNESENKIMNTKDDLNQLLSKLELEIRKEIEKRKWDTLNKLKAYFDSGADNVQLMEKYREQFKLSISSLCSQLQDNSVQKCKNAINRCVGSQKVDAIWNECNKKIEEQVKKLLQQCKRKQQVLCGVELKDAFEMMWRDTLSQLNYQPCPERNIEVEIENLLRDNTKTQGGVINERLERKPLSELGTDSFQIGQRHVNKQLMEKMKLRFSVQQSDLERAGIISKSLETKCRQQIDKVAKMDMDYDNKYCIELLNNVDEKINNISDAKFKMSEIFRAEFKLHICGYAAPKLKDMHIRFINKHDPRKRLESMKDQYFELFMDIYTEQDQNQKQVERFAKSCFLPALRNTTFQSLGLKIVSDMKIIDPEGRYKLRNNFNVALLVHLKQRNSFHEYCRYINDFENFANDWLHDQVIAHCKTQRKGESTFTRLAKEIITEITGQAKEVVRDAVAQNVSGNVESFLDLFVEKLKTRIVMSKDGMKLVQFQIDRDSKKFVEAVLPSIVEVEELLLKEVTGWDVEAKIEELSVKPNEELFKGLFCCTKKCPFCGVFCDSESPEHNQHFSKQHRPEGLNSYRWSDNKCLTVDICTALVASDTRFQNDDTDQVFIYYKDYQTVNDYYKSWTIQRDLSAEASSYWKKVFYLFNLEFAERYQARPAVISNAWNIEWDKVREDLNKTYNTNIQSL